MAEDESLGLDDVKRAVELLRGAIGRAVPAHEGVYWSPHEMRWLADRLVWCVAEIERLRALAAFTPQTTALMRRLIKEQRIVAGHTWQQNNYRDFLPGIVEGLAAEARAILAECGPQPEGDT